MMNRPPIKKTCPECGGDGIADFKRDTPPERDMPCNNCLGTGEVYNYLTPAGWEAETGEKMLRSDDVWWMSSTTTQWSRTTYATILYLQSERSHRVEDLIMVVKRPGQPKPDDLWRPE